MPNSSRQDQASQPAAGHETVPAFREAQCVRTQRVYGEIRPGNRRERISRIDDFEVAEQG